MTGDAYPLSKDVIRADAIEILSALGASRDNTAAFEANWRRLWQLVREVQAASLAFHAPDGGPWYYQKDGGPSKISVALAAGDFALPVWPPEEPRSPTELPELLNWAGVPIYVTEKRAGRRREDNGERATDAAEQRREEAELYRRRSEEGRQIAEGLRLRGEDLRHDEEEVRLTAERLRDSQEAGRELAETARDLAEALRRTIEDANASADDMRTSLGEIKELAKKQRQVLERQEQALAALTSRVRELTPPSKAENLPKSK